MTRSIVIAILILAGFAGFTKISNHFATKSAPVTATVSQTGLAVGNTAPDLKYTSPDGQEISLSSLKGKLVLIDFWASWCPPCRAENPNLVATYQKYKDKNFTAGKGFTIYSVSLDKAKASWVNAIKSDKLDWPYHVSDLKYWNSEAASIYKVESIPASFLIDANGKILAKNLRGAQLGAKLESLLKK